MIRMTAPATAVLSRRAINAWLRKTGEQRTRQQKHQHEERVATRRRDRRAAGDMAAVGTAMLALLGFLLGLIVSVITLLPLAINGSLGGSLSDWLLVALIWLAAALLARSLFASLSWRLLVVAGAALLGGQFASTVVLPDRFPPTAGLPAILGVAIPALVVVWRRRGRGLGTGVGKPRTASTESPALADLPPLHLRGRVAELVERCSLSGRIGEHLRKQRVEALDGLEQAVAAMGSAASAHRFSGFWTAVETASSQLEALRVVNERFQSCADLWRESDRAGRIALHDHRKFEWAQALPDDPEPGYAVIFDDGESARAVVALDPADGLAEIPYAELPGTFTSPRFEVDLAAVERLEQAYARYADLLLAADQDHEMASIGQEFFNRQALREGFSRLAQTIAGVGAALCVQMQRSQADLTATIERSTDRMVTQMAAGTAATGQQAAALQASLGRIESASRSVQVVYSINR